MRELSVLIPARNEQFLKNTIEDVLSHIEADTEIICVCDGGWPLESIPDHPRLTLVYHAQARGQRAAVNLAAKLSNAKYIMKLDAHCSVAKGFDAQLIKDYQDGQTVVPRMFTLHVFDWVCSTCGKRIYQGGYPGACIKRDDFGNEIEVNGCQGKEFKQEMVWKRRRNKRTDFAYFDRTLHYRPNWREYELRPTAAGEIDDVMCFVGACFFMPRERYWQLDGLDEKHGSWGQMGVELSCKTWLSGGQLVVNKKTWFAHLFRTRPNEDFGFPYNNPAGDQEKAREYSRWLWNLEQPDQLPKWDKAIYPLQWVVDKFAPVPEWSTEGVLHGTR
jgi:glycosyltransferase involved in cell wall biosynthesis